MFSRSLKILVLVVLWGAVVYAAARFLPPCGIQVSTGIRPSEGNVLSLQFGVVKQVQELNTMNRM